MFIRILKKVGLPLSIHTSNVPVLDFSFLFTGNFKADPKVLICSPIQSLSYSSPWGRATRSEDLKIKLDILYVAPKKSFLSLFADL